MNRVLLSIEGRIATLKLSRPDSLNAMDGEMIHELHDKIKEIASSDADILIIQGDGRAFSAGGDIKAMLINTDDDSFDRLMDLINDMMLTLYTMPKLVISAVHGSAAGLGFSLALVADHVIAEQSAILAMNFINIGLIPDGGGHFLLKQRLGETKTKQVIWEGKRLTAHEAHALGLVDDVCMDHAVDAAHRKAAVWLQKPIEAMIKTKKIMVDSNRAQFIEILKMEKLGQKKMRHTANHKEGLNAFIEKRNPIFSTNVK
ncbi:enoyl-CoA hydratase [Bacillus sp. Marseille-P3661]|uniref:enoyl-CoA hydratase n=1 Tax=Bacillus sp. Marseille-P3661 TaxID=1936234 RepID=UPI000C83FE63|nr:enoyl-CoA hydratase [Bacillus sp. Marseille-P3661]